MDVARLSVSLKRFPYRLMILWETPIWSATSVCCMPEKDLNLDSFLLMLNVRVKHNLLSAPTK